MSIIFSDLVSLLIIYTMGKSLVRPPIRPKDKDKTIQDDESKK